MQKIYDLSLEPCPMNLVKFKFYLSIEKNFTVILGINQEEALKGITNFLNYKKVQYTLLKEKDKIKIII